MFSPDKASVALLNGIVLDWLAGINIENDVFPLPILIRPNQESIHLSYETLRGVRLTIKYERGTIPIIYF